jgi:peptidoglycan/xylan/chitin deacetylase (PgdA/CDA1 family)
MIDKKIVSLSFDDNKIHDIRFSEVLDKFGVKCTFNVNSISIGRDAHIDKVFLRELSNRHEIAGHTVSHTQFLPDKPVEEIRYQVFDDKKAIEDMIGKEIHGFAYPYGQYSKQMMDIVKESGYSYARTIDNTYGFSFDCDNFYAWHPTCHQENTFKVIDKWQNEDNGLFFIWGHSREFTEDWKKLDDLLRRLKDVPNVEYMTNFDVYSLINKK